MEPKAFDRALRAFCRRKPFKPFLVKLTSGTQFQVEHPEALAYQGGSAVHISAEGDYTLFDHQSVARLADLEHPVTSGGNPEG